MTVSETVIEAKIAKRIKLVGLDVDGVMTDAGVYMGMAGDRAVELKRFDIQDGIGVRLLREGGIEVVIVSGRLSRATELRAEELGITDVVQDDQARKLPAFKAMLDRRELRWEDAAFMGDDLPDLPLLTRVGLPVAVGNAVPEVIDAATFVTEATGGRGAVREFTEALLKARGEWEVAMQRYLAEREETSKVSYA